MEILYNKARTEEVVPGTRPAGTKACALLGVQASVVDLDDDSYVGGEETLRSDKEAAILAGFCRFFTLMEYLAPSTALPIRGNFLGFLGRRVRLFGLSDTQKRVLLSWGADSRAALKVYENADPEVLVQARDRDEAIDCHKRKKPRRQRRMSLSLRLIFPYACHLRVAGICLFRMNCWPAARRWPSFPFRRARPTRPIAGARTRIGRRRLATRSRPMPA